MLGRRQLPGSAFGARFARRGGRVRRRRSRPALRRHAPAWLCQTTVFSGLGNPTVVRFAPERPHVRGEQERDRQRVRRHFDTTPRSSWTCAPQRARLLGSRAAGAWRSIPGSRQGVRTCTCSTRTTERRSGPRSRAGTTTCPTPPGATADGCVSPAGGRGSSATGVETVLIEDFCQQYPSHSVGWMNFGPDGRAAA